MSAQAIFRKRLFQLFVAVLVLSVLVAGGAVWYHKTRPYHFLTVTPGVLYRSGTLQPHNLEKMIERYGIKTVVNLRPLPKQSKPDWYIEEAGICRLKGVKLVNIPMLGNTPPSEEQLAQWLTLLDNKENLPILVHCAQGVIRSGIMVAIYEMEYLKKDNERTLAELPMFGHELYVPKRKRMREFILNYVPRREAD
jgi:tyrosine-protein phosphatase SIW14